LAQNLLIANTLLEFYKLIREVVFFEQLFTSEAQHYTAHFEDSSNSADLSARLSYGRA
jgi:hypothetical protein